MVMEKFRNFIKKSLSVPASIVHKLQFFSIHKTFGTLLAAFCLLSAGFWTFIAPAPAMAQNQIFVFSGSGWGHGVGLSQYGAYGRAEDGHTHKEILDFYYESTQIIDADIPSDFGILLSSGKSVTLTPYGENRITIDSDTLTRPSINTPITFGLEDGDWKISTPQGSLCPAGGCRGATIQLHFATGTSVLASSTGNSYLHGRFTMTKVNDNELRLVLDTISLQHYMYGIAEMPSDWHIEALKAQAVAARSYAYATITQRRNSPSWDKPFDLYASTSDQVYVGDAQELNPDAKRWLQAVDETQGQILTDERNNPVFAFYSSSNGGHTATSGEVFSRNLSYLVSKPDPYDYFNNTNSEWQKVYISSELSQWLNLFPDTSIGNLHSIDIKSGRGASGRINSARIQLTGSEGSRTISGARFFAVVNGGIYRTGYSWTRQLPSTLLVLLNESDDSQLEIAEDILLQSNVKPPAMPVGALEGFEYGISSKNIYIKGWAFDGELSEDSRLQIRFYLNGSHIASVESANPRPDIHSKLGYGYESGFRILLPVSDEKTNSYCVIAEDLSAKEKTLLGCKSRGYSGTSPFGEVSSFERLENGDIRIRGWALDADEHSRAVSVRISVKGKLEIISKADKELEEFEKGMGAKSGFDVVFTPSRQTGQVCVTAADLGFSRTSSNLLGCWKL